jgi:hypothetical protein
MAAPSMTKPDLWLKSGQFREKYDLKRGSSVIIRKAAVWSVKEIGHAAGLAYC